MPVADLPDGQYQFDPADRALTARSGKRRFRLGNRLMVQVARVDKLLRRAYFLPVLDTKRRPGLTGKNSGSGTSNPEP